MHADKIVYIDRRTGEKRTEKVPGEGLLRFLYHNPWGRLPLEMVVKRKIVSALYGRWMDQKVSRRKIREFVQSLDIPMEESEKDIDDFRTFNEFFVRKLKPGAREIGHGLVSPADGKIVAFEDIGSMDSFFAKGQAFSLDTFLQDRAMVEKFTGGTLIIVRLAPADYHRFHFPCEGLPGESRRIRGFYYSVSPYAVRNNLEIFCRNRREYCILTTDAFGDMIVSEIGATMVGSIVQTYTPGSRVARGQEKRLFRFWRIVGHPAPATGLREGAPGHQGKHAQRV